VQSLRLRPSETTFVDYGSGKGRVCMVAAQAGFRRVIGVEFSPELCTIARSNVARFVAAGGASEMPEIVLGDAGAFDPPPGPLLAYLYNPFGPPVLDEVVERLAAKAEAGDPIFVCYVDPQHLGAFAGWQVRARTDEYALLRAG
jgi:SAM-dependent methyltransferase